MGCWQRLIDLFRTKLKPADREFIETYLDEPGLFLFTQMSYSDQKHSIAMARFLLGETENLKGVDFQSLIQGALLHDVGKVKGEMSRLNRIIVGVIRRLFPGLRKKWGQRGKNRSLRHALYVDLIHPSRGAYMAESLGIDPKVVSLIKQHHDPKTDNTDLELSLLQMADEKN
jgi:putative nucleotidyltransferase with HDIG domain